MYYSYYTFTRLRVQFIYLILSFQFILAEKATSAAHLGEPSFQQTVDEAAVLTGITCIPDEHNNNQ